MPCCMVLFVHADSASKGAFQNVKTTIKFTCELLSYSRASDPEGLRLQERDIDQYTFESYTESDKGNCPSAGAGRREHV